MDGPDERVGVRRSRRWVSKRRWAMAALPVVPATSSVRVTRRAARRPFIGTNPRLTVAVLLATVHRHEAVAEVELSQFACSGIDEEVQRRRSTRRGGRATNANGSSMQNDERGGPSVRLASPAQGSTGVVQRRAVDRDRSGVRGGVPAGGDTWRRGRRGRHALPTMVKGPLTVTDLINMHMGGGWFGYGNPPLRLAFENRKKVRGFYTKNEFERVGCRAAGALGARVGAPSRRAAAYDIGPMRWAWLQHYCTNWGGDDGWLFRVRGEFRKFNYMGDTTWITAVGHRQARRCRLGAVVDIEVTGTNQRGQQNINGWATFLVAPRRGPVQFPDAPPLPGRTAELTGGPSRFGVGAARFREPSSSVARRALCG